jgi:hypothetical protein
MSILNKAYKAHDPAAITQAENKFLEQLTRGVPLEFQIALLTKILKKIGEKNLPQLRDRLVWAEHTKALKDAYEGLKRVDYVFKKYKNGVTVVEKVAPGDGKPSSEKKAFIPNQDALKKLYERLIKAAKADQMKIVLEYISLMKLEYLYCTSTHYTLEDVHTEEDLHGADIKETCLRRLERDSVVGQCLNLCYAAYLPNESSDDKKHSHRSKKYDDLMEKAAKLLPPSSKNSEAITAIKELQKLGLTQEAKYLCACSIRLYKESEFEQKLFEFVGGDKLDQALALCDTRPDKIAYGERLIEVAAAHSDAREAADKCAKLLKKHPNCIDALAALRDSLNRLDESNKETSIRIWKELIRMHPVNPSYKFHRYLSKVLISLNYKHEDSREVWQRLAKNPAGDKVAADLDGRYKKVMGLSTYWSNTCPVCVSERVDTKCRDCKHLYCNTCANKLFDGREKCYWCGKEFDKSSNLNGARSWEYKDWMETCMDSYFRSVGRRRK